MIELTITVPRGLDRYNLAELGARHRGETRGETHLETQRVTIFVSQEQISALEAKGDPATLIRSACIKLAENKATYGSVRIVCAPEQKGRKPKPQPDEPVLKYMFAPRDATKLKILSATTTGRYVPEEEF